MPKPIQLTQLATRSTAPAHNIGPVTSSMVQFRAGQMIFRQGDPGDRAYIVQSGVVEIFREVENVRRTICSVSDRGLFGEMALVDGNTRSANAIAKTDVNLIIITAEKFEEKFANSTPFVRSMVRMLARNLRATNAMVDESILRTLIDSPEVREDIANLLS